ncbi:MAG TPA: ATP-binding cassette domain-containing protein [Candidatus Deferrimicrobiaceae bacterium]|jgi:phospholipid/cholesterol/gamma-HCH transport system ATP-binding protein
MSANAPKPGAPVIEVEGLTAGYGERILLRDVTFTVRAGELFAILGQNGCGKSTLLRHLIGLQRPMAGTIRLLGVNIATTDEATLRDVRRRIGVLFQAGGLLNAMTVGENIALPLSEHTTLSDADIDGVIREKLAMVNLSRARNRLPSELSGGMKRRAALARAMALDPPLLFFDEPSAGLDPVNSLELDLLIEKLNRDTGTTMIVVTHELPSIFRIARRVIFLDPEAQGIIAEGDAAVLRESSHDPRVSNFLNRRLSGPEG